MPLQSRLRLIKRSRLYEYRGDFRGVPPVTRGVYVLYRERLPKRKSGRPIYEVSHIGVAGVATEATTGMSSRLKNHHKNKAGWTHYSIFEVHDNVRGEEIRELEGLLLRIFRDDPRVALSNEQLGGKVLNRLSGKDLWK
jgi:hypothetical protein